MNEASRREFVQGATMLALVATTAEATVQAVATEKEASGSAFEHQHVPLALPFEAKSLSGISQRLIQSHWENNYGGAVKALNVVRARLGQALRDPNTPPYVYNGLKREQLIRTGSVVLHEHYFANLGGTGKADADVRSKISVAFGTYDAWESEFRKIGQGLAGGSGWVVLGFNRRLKLLENYWLADHATAPAETVPILVMDMYEHAYQLDYGAAAGKYIDAFFVNINWEAAGQRL
jgi:Fe-Mn family superoxide dismutase